MSNLKKNSSTILAIDAAWTGLQPSGVALVQSDGSVWRCLAIAPSYRSFIALARGIRVDWNQTVFHGDVPAPEALLKAAQDLANSNIDLVAVDMPLSRLPIDRRRQADNVISTEFGGRWCSAHTPNANRPGQIGIDLMNGFFNNGFILTTEPNEDLYQSRLIEVYPHPALLSLMHVNQRIPYKVSKSARYWPGTNVNSRIQNIVTQFNSIHDALSAEFGLLHMQIPNPINVHTLAFLKRFEDVLDALICAWVGKEFLAGNTVPLGDENAAIWCPSDVVFGNQ